MIKLFEEGIGYILAPRLLRKYVNGELKTVKIIEMSLIPQENYPIDRIEQRLNKGVVV